MSARWSGVGANYSNVSISWLKTWFRLSPGGVFVWSGSIEVHCGAPVLWANLLGTVDLASLSAARYLTALRVGVLP